MFVSLPTKLLIVIISEGRDIKKKRVRNHFPFYSIYISPCFCLVTKLCPTLWDPMDQAALSLGFSRQEYWSGLPCPPPGDLPNPGIEPVFPALAGRFFTTETPGKPERALGALQMGRVRVRGPRCASLGK